jgi:hypothetical protein
MDAAEMLTARVIAAPCEPMARAPEQPGPARPSDGLTEPERGILAFERQRWLRQGAKERAIRDLLNLSVARYYQVLNALLDKPEALRADPMLIKRLRTLRTGRQRARTARRLGIE